MNEFIYFKRRQLDSHKITPQTVLKKRDFGTFVPSKGRKEKKKGYSDLIVAKSMQSGGWGL